MPEKLGCAGHRARIRLGGVARLACTLVQLDADNPHIEPSGSYIEPSRTGRKAELPISLRSCTRPDMLVKSPSPSAPSIKICSVPIAAKDPGP